MKVVEGVLASNGITIARAYCLESSSFKISKKQINEHSEEISRFQDAIKQAKLEIDQIKERTEMRLGTEKASIFSAQLLILEDPEFIGEVTDKIKSENVNAEYAANVIADKLVSLFEAIENDYMRERATDIRDVTDRLIAILLHVELPNLDLITDEVIIVAEDLTPSVTAQLDKQYIKGFVTNIGGRTSHTAIMARSMGIPAVVGTKNIMEKVKNNDLLIVDGEEGYVIINPTEEKIKEYHEKKKQFELKSEELKKLINTKTVTADGHSIELSANIGTPEEVQNVLEHGAEGIGLYRTEFLYMNRDQLPNEEEQFAAYKRVLEEMKNKPVVIRTLDIGGDKELPYLHFPKEMNPFLGMRAIRYCLENKTVFRTQLRALLRASKFGNLKIMFPMIATLEELREAKQLLQDERDVLLAEGVLLAESIKIGMMIETPASVAMADHFAKEVDFFSIGTNDLIQYTMAADRMNENISYLYQPFNPAILRSISRVIEAAHNEGIRVGMCGEMAGDNLAIPVLLALGLDEFSMSPSSILPARLQLTKLSREMTNLKKELLHLQTAADVHDYLKDHKLLSC